MSELQQLRARVAELMPKARDELSELVAIPSVADPQVFPGPVLDHALPRTVQVPAPMTAAGAGSVIRDRPRTAQLLDLVIAADEFRLVHPGDAEAPGRSPSRAQHLREHTDIGSGDAEHIIGRQDHGSRFGVRGATRHKRTRFRTTP